jgi:hypothetical protein
MGTMYERDGEWYEVPKPESLKLVVRSALLNALAYTDGHQRKAAKLLGLSPRQFCYQLKMYGVPGARGPKPIPDKRANVPVVKQSTARRGVVAAVHPLKRPTT